MRPKPLPRRGLPRRRRLRPLLTLRRQPGLWWAVVLSLALAVGWIVAGAVARADAARLAWGDATRVVVASRDLAPGDEVGPGDVEVVERPTATVPDGALTAPPSGQAARAAVFEGEVLIADRLAPAGVRGVAARVPAGARAVAIPIEPGTAPPVRVGDLVDVLVALPVEASGGGPPGFAVATGALVVDVTDAAVTIAVARDAAPRLAVALGQGAVTIALVGA